jgi:hypothetical protein
MNYCSNGFSYIIQSMFNLLARFKEKTYFVSVVVKMESIVSDIMGQFLGPETDIMGEILYGKINELCVQKTA